MCLTQTTLDHLQVKNMKCGVCSDICLSDLSISSDNNQYTNCIWQWCTHDPDEHQSGCLYAASTLFISVHQKQKYTFNKNHRKKKKSHKLELFCIVYLETGMHKKYAEINRVSWSHVSFCWWSCDVFCVSAEYSIFIRRPAQTQHIWTKKALGSGSSCTFWGWCGRCGGGGVIRLHGFFIPHTLLLYLCLVFQIC